MTESSVLIPRKDLRSAIKRLATEIKRDYAGKNPLVIGILKGSFIFMADLVRQLDFPLEVDFITLASYKNMTESSGEVCMERSFTTPLEGRHILIVEDIIDSGLTLNYLLNYIKTKKNAASLRLCVLLDKPSRRKAQVKVDYTGFTVPDKFIVGYGLDCAQKYRNLPDICCLEEHDR
jgi:hypoxanthine phosphoribosyltransferase